MFGAGLGLGVLAGGAVMYYIQPTIKLWVARAFGWEAQIATEFDALAERARAAQKSFSSPS